MKKTDLGEMSVDRLVRDYVNLAIEQDDALLGFDTKEVNRLFWRLAAIEDELKSRSGDQRHALIPLHNHPNPQVRLKAAQATLAIAPQTGRQVLQAIVDAKIDPQRLDAGMSLFNLDRGVYKPK